MSQQLTPKQTQVYDLLVAGDKPSAVAKRMKISQSGVYGHIRKIREAGFTIPSEQIGTSDAAETPAPAAATNGASSIETPEDVARVIKAAVITANERLAAITEQEKGISTRLEQLGVERQAIVARVEKLDKAQEVLV